MKSVVAKHMNPGERPLPDGREGGVGMPASCLLARLSTCSARPQGGRLYTTLMRRRAQASNSCEPSRTGVLLELSGSDVAMGDPSPTSSPQKP